jgi:hypothetical protein
VRSQTGRMRSGVGLDILVMHYLEVGTARKEPLVSWQPRPCSHTAINCEAWNGIGAETVAEYVRLRTIRLGSGLKDLPARSR